jgi:hypothetical protein
LKASLAWRLIGRVQRLIQKKAAPVAAAPAKASHSGEAKPTGRLNDFFDVYDGTCFGLGHGCTLLQLIRRGHRIFAVQHGAALLFAITKLI